MRKPKILRSFWPNLLLEIGPMRDVVTGCSGQHLKRLSLKFLGVAGRRIRIFSATVFAIGRNFFKSKGECMCMDREINSTTSSDPEINGISI